MIHRKNEHDAYRFWASLPWTWKAVGCLILLVSLTVGAIILLDFWLSK